MIRKTISAVFLAAGLGLPVWAEGFQTVAERQGFLGLIQGKTLSRLGIRLDVLASGGIEGRAFGRPVTGAWRWQGGYFCRDLYFGGRDLGPNCQVVQVKGDTIRFIADRGAGQSADLVIR